MEKFSTRESKISTTETNETLDSRWYSRFEELNFQDFAQLDGDGKHRELEKEAFLSGISENPDLDYPALENFNFEAREQALLELKADVIEQEPNEIVKNYIEQKLTNLLLQ